MMVVYALLGRPRRRGYADGLSWTGIREIVIKKAGSASELEKEGFRVASGGEDGCKLARDPDPQAQKELLDLLHCHTPGQLAKTSARRTSQRLRRANPSGYGSDGRRPG